MTQVLKTLPLENRNWQLAGNKRPQWVFCWFLAACCFAQPLNLQAQTPWQASPAQPAQSLPPPPPSKSPVFRQTAPNPGSQELPPLPSETTPVKNPQSERAGGALSAAALQQLEQRLSQVSPRSETSGSRAPQVGGIASLPIPSLGSIGSPVPNDSAPRMPVPSATTPPFQLPSSTMQTPPTEGNLVATKSIVGRTETPSIEAGSGRLFEPGKLIAVVGSEHVLAGDLAHFVEPVIEQNRDRIPKAQEPEIREQIMRQALKTYVVTKAMHQEFFRDAAGAATPDKVEESKQMVTTRAREIFFDKQVPDLMQRYEVNTMRELERKLRERSMALSTMQRQFVEQILASELERKYIPQDFEFSRQELLDYYQAHLEQWQKPSRARWQQLTVRFDKHGYDRAQVEQRIKELGNEIYLGGKSFEVVAQQSSEGYSASQGGLQEWTALGSLKSKPVEQTVFSIELNRLSKIIADDVGMHIVRVLGREEAHRQSFADVQTEIRKTLSQERRQKELAEFRKTVVDRTPIWSLWPGDLQGKRVFPLSQALGEQ